MFTSNTPATKATKKDLEVHAEVKAVPVVEKKAEVKAAPAVEKRPAAFTPKAPSDE